MTKKPTQARFNGKRAYVQPADGVEVMRRRLIASAPAIFACLLSVCLNSCTKRCVDIRMFNHTGARITILGFDLGGERNTWVLNEGQSAVVWNNMSRWEIRKTKPAPAVWFYHPGAIKYVAEQYLTNNWLRCRHAAAQIEADGSIWVLPPDTSMIVAQSPPQPAGYPAKPDKVEKGQ